MLKHRIGFMTVLACAGLHAATVVAQDPEQCSCVHFSDCNCNGVDDICDLSCSATGTYCVNGTPYSAGCNSGYHPSCGTSNDCDGDGSPDECDYTRSDWYHPCAADPETTLVCGGIPGFPPENCQCEADWATASNWAGGAPYTCTDEVRFVHSNAAVGFCDGGSTPGAVCTVNADCGRGTCILEEKLVVDLATADTNPKLVVKADINFGVTDALVLTITGGTATFGVVELDGVNGPVTLSGQVKTN